MKYKVSTLEVKEWGNLGPVVEVCAQLRINDKMKRQLSLDYVVEKPKESAVSFSITWTFVVFQREAPLFKYVGEIKAQIEKETSLPSMKEIYDLIFNILFFRYTLHYYWTWQEENPIVNYFGCEIDILSDKHIFNLADEIRTNLMLQEGARIKM